MDDTDLEVEIVKKKGGRPKNAPWVYHARRVEETRCNSIADFYEDVGYQDVGIDTGDNRGHYDWLNDINQRMPLAKGTYYPKYEFLEHYLKGEYPAGMYPGWDKFYKRGEPGSIVPSKPLPKELKVSKFWGLLPDNPRVLELLQDKDREETDQWVSQHFALTPRVGYRSKSQLKVVKPKSSKGQ